MEDNDKTKKQFINELVEARQRIAELEKTEKMLKKRKSTIIKYNIY